MTTDATLTMPTPAPQGFFHRFIKGEMSLASTYWVFGVLIGQIGLPIFAVMAGGILSTPSPSLPGAAIALGFFASVLAYYLMTYVAIWRSAGQYKGRAIWAILARIFVVLQSLSLFALSALIGVGGILAAWQDSDVTPSPLAKEIQQLNQGLPVMLDSQSRLDSATVQGKHVFYNVTLVGASKENINADIFRTIQETQLKTSTCFVEDIRTLLSSGVTITYQYFDKANKPLTSIDIDKSVCP